MENFHGALQTVTFGESKVKGNRMGKKVCLALHCEFWTKAKAGTTTDSLRLVYKQNSVKPNSQHIIPTSSIVYHSNIPTSLQNSVTSYKTMGKAGFIVRDGWGEGGWGRGHVVAC